MPPVSPGINLREATRSENRANQFTNKARFKARFKGTWWIARTNRWHAELTLNACKVCLGSFPPNDEALASLHYDAAAQLTFGKFASLNFPAADSVHIVLPDRVLDRITSAKTKGK
jgi:hypothetical protein